LRVSPATNGVSSNTPGDLDPRQQVQIRLRQLLLQARGALAPAPPRWWLKSTAVVAVGHSPHLNSLNINDLILA